MIKLATMRRVEAEAIPAHTTTLSVSWLNNQFKAVAVHRGTVEGTYEHPVDVDGANNFEALIREAVRQTGYHGQTVSLVLAHPRLAQQLVDVPPLKDAAVRRVLQRQAQQQKLFPGEAAWAYQRSLSAKGAQQVILHLFPKGLQDQLVQGAQRNSLHLVSLVPPSALIHRQLARLGAEKGDLNLLAAETGGSTTIVIARGDGQIVLVRTLTGTWNDGPERLALDLNRTLPFIAQQFGSPVKNLWLFGPGAAEQREAMQRTMQLGLHLSPVEHTPLYWAIEALKLQPSETPNFITPVMQQAPQRRAFAKVTAVAAGFVLLASLATAAVCQFQAKQEASRIDNLQKNAARLKTSLDQLNGQTADLAREQQMVQLVIDGKEPPVPLWFLGYLGEAVPRDLVVTNLHVKRDGDVWQVQMAGVPQTTVQAVTLESFSLSVAKLTANLANGPFHVSVPGAGKTPKTRELRFLIEGVMR
ncbi:MAG: hypothetical protein C5B50_09015 [Verrucomicrobia bacterium]|nr:MAG: hypothetical protein C5B50_09015 [Verrucomicrobiota bacterium]